MFENYFLEGYGARERVCPCYSREYLFWIPSARVTIEIRRGGYSRFPRRSLFPNAKGGRVTPGAKQSRPSTIVIEDPYYTMYPFLLASSKMALTRKFLH